MAFTDFKVVKVMSRRNFNRTRTLFRIGMIIGNNRNNTINNRNNAIFSDKMCQFFVVFGNGNGGIAEHGFRTGGGNMDKLIRVIFKRIFVVIHFADGFFLNNLQI